MKGFSVKDANFSLFSSPGEGVADWSSTLSIKPPFYKCAMYSILVRMRTKGLKWNMCTQLLIDSGCRKKKKKKRRKKKVRQMEEDGDISSLFRAARGYFVSVTKYAISHLPLDDKLLEHTRFVNLDALDSCTISDVEYFASRFDSQFKYSTRDLSDLQEEFVDLQFMPKADIPQRIWKEAEVQDHDSGNCHYRMDVVWAYLSQLKTADGKLRFKHLSQVARSVLTLLHSKAEEESVFSNNQEQNCVPSKSCAGWPVQKQLSLVINLSPPMRC